MSKNQNLSTDSDSFSKNLLEETPENDYQRHMADIEFQHNNAAGNYPLYSNFPNFHSECGSTASYFEEPNNYFNEDFQTHHRPDVIVPFFKLPNRMRFNTDDCYKNPTSNNLDLTYPSDMPRNYLTQDRQNESEYERNSNILYSQHNSERKNFNNYNLGYRHNNLRDDINRPRETNPPESEYERNTKFLNAHYNSERKNFNNYNLGYRDNNLRNDNINRPRKTNPPESKYERNTNFLNAHYNSEKENFNNYNLGYRDNNLRNDINRPRKTNPPESEYERNTNFLNAHFNTERENFNNYNLGYRDNNLKNDINRPRKTNPPESEYERNTNFLNAHFNTERENFNNYNLGYRDNNLRNDINRPRKINPPESEYERNTNFLNHHYNSERENFNNYNLGYRDNNLRNDISRPRETHSSSSFAGRKEIYTSTPKWSNSTEGDSPIKRINSREKRRETPTERPFYGSQSDVRTQRIPNLNFPPKSFENRISLKNKKFDNAFATDRRSGIKMNKQSKNETIETQNKFKVSPKNDKVINKKSENRNGKECEFVCPHCNLKYFTSHQYIAHLNSLRHLKILQQVVSRRNNSLKKLRAKQRIEQNILEENAGDLESCTNVCHTCRLNYKQSEATHNASKYHMKIKDFLEQHCEICNISLRNHVGYESHICSLAHLKRKIYLDINKIIVVADQNIDEANGEADDVDIDISKKDLVIVGREEVCKVEAYYCKLCKIYLPQINNDRLEEVISAHCSEQFHLEQYQNYRKSNKPSNSDEVLSKQEDVKKEKIVDDEVNKCLYEELPDVKEPQPKENATEEYEEALNRVENSENKDDIDNSYCNNEQFSIMEQSVLKKEISVKDGNNFFNLQENVNIDDPEEVEKDKDEYSQSESEPC